MDSLKLISRQESGFSDNGARYQSVNWELVDTQTAEGGNYFYFV